jgi:hypothetical protein
VGELYKLRVLGREKVLEQRDAKLTALQGGVHDFLEPPYVLYLSLSVEVEDSRYLQRCLVKKIIHGKHFVALCGNEVLLYISETRSLRITSYL